MKRLLVLMAAAGLLLLPLQAYAQTGTDVKAEEAAKVETKAPPVSQDLVREGDFAILLVEKLKLGTAESEAEAEDMLSAAGVMPKNGWIADYPVTPDIVGELEESIVAAAEAGSISLGKAEATGAFYELTAELGISVRPASGDEVQVGETTAEYLEPAVIEYYYYEESPPVITYYAPPYDYFYLYGWVPYPFWWYGFYFPGYYILTDFHVVSHFHHHHRHFAHRDRDGHKRFVSNHVRDRHTKRVGRVDRITRRVDTTSRVRTGDRRAERGFRSDESRRGASRILERSASGRSARADVRAERRDARRDARTFNRDARRDARTLGRDSRDTRSGGRAFSRETRTDSRDLGRVERGGGDRSFRGARGGGERSFDRASRGGDRSFRGARGGGERSFDRASGGGSRSFGGGERSFSRGGSGSQGGGGRSFSRGGSGSRGGGGGRSFGGGGGRGGGGGGGWSSGGGRGGGGCRGRC